MIKRHLNASRKKSHRGVTLLELLLVVAAGVIILIGGILGYQRVTSNNMLNDGFTQIQTTVSQVRQLYSGGSGYGTDDFTADAVTNRVFDNKWLDANNTPTNPWGGSITLTGNNRTFTIDSTQIPQDACARMIAMNGTGFGGAVQSITVNGSDLGSQNVTVADATAACSDSTNNEIVWEIR